MVIIHSDSMKEYGLNVIEVGYDRVNHSLNVHGSITLIRVNGLDRMQPQKYGQMIQQHGPVHWQVSLVVLFCFDFFFIVDN
ncbi:hypothetical protein BLA29_011656 [Euroglyphus maynei]|uniref:Uncharacterized protein n=1 Tax=Euroglyphus maynei TaxID=6958 RepID=A0A1Y3BKW7_EURMA|nr:hypothetical protein BLA29_011656 [Euroglyphus maynei]